MSNDRTQTFNVSRVGTANDGNERAKARNKKWVWRGAKNGRNHEGKGGKHKYQEDEEDKDKDKEVKDRYYTPKEYSAFTPAQRAKLQKLRDARQRQAAATLSEMAVKVAALHEAQEGLHEIVDSDPDTSAGGNRNHAALQRKKHKKD